MDLVDDLGGVGGVYDVQGGEAGLLSEGYREHLGAEARAAHAEQQNGLEASRFDVGCESRKSGEILLLALDDVNPAQPLFLAIAGPECWVLTPEAIDFAGGLPVGEGRIEGGAKLRRGRKSKVHIVLDSAS